MNGLREVTSEKLKVKSGPAATCSRCDWAWFAADWPNGPGPIEALLEHNAGRMARAAALRDMAEAAR